MTLPGAAMAPLTSFRLARRKFGWGCRREPEGGRLKAGRSELGGVTFGLPGLDAAVQQPHLAEGEAIMG